MANDNITKTPRLAALDEADRTADLQRRLPVALRIERDGHPPAVAALDPATSLRFGREEDMSWVFPAEEVSRQHGRLDFTNERWSYRDLGSRNGSFLVHPDAPPDEDPRHHSTKLTPNKDTWPRPGDVILLGNRLSRIVFLDEVPHELRRSSTAGPRSAATIALERAIDVCARHDLPVVLLGLSGTGKTHFARAIHDLSGLKGSFVNINCGRLPAESSQLSSELLGHTRGAFTGAVGERTGKLWAADGGTLFLDEVESMPPTAQDFFIDLLENTGDFAPLGTSGGVSLKPPKFRLISASKKPLARSGLRADLCQRLAVGDHIKVPSLAERSDDIPSFVEAFVQALMVEKGVDIAVTPEAMAFLKSANWTGELRELKAAVSAVVTRELVALRSLHSGASRVTVGLPAFRSYLTDRAQSFGAADSRPPPTGRTVVVDINTIRRRPADLTRQDIERVLAEHGGNKTQAAKALGMAINTLKAKLRG